MCSAHPSPPFPPDLPAPVPCHSVCLCWAGPLSGDSSSWFIYLLPLCLLSGSGVRVLSDSLLPGGVMHNLSYFNTVAINKHTALCLCLPFSYPSSCLVLLCQIVTFEEEVFSLEHFTSYSATCSHRLKWACVAMSVCGCGCWWGKRPRTKTKTHKQRKDTNMIRSLLQKTSESTFSTLESVLRSRFCLACPCHLLLFLHVAWRRKGPSPCSTGILAPGKWQVKL